MTSNPAKQRAPWLLGFLLLSQVILMSISARSPNSEQSFLRTWVMSGASLVTRAGNWAVSLVTGTIGGYVALRGAHEENKALREQVEQLTSERDQAREQAAEDARIRAQYGIPSNAQYHEIAASVVSRDPSIWFRRLVINRGTNDGVKLSMPVATGTGIVGRVISVGPNFAEVQVITDRHAGVGAMLQVSGAMGEVHGLDSGRCELRDISSSEGVEAGSPVVTNGLDGIYPKGLMVGTVESVQDDPNNPWHRIIIKPSAPVDRLENVVVLLVEHKDMKMQETIK